MGIVGAIGCEGNGTERFDEFFAVEDGKLGDVVELGVVKTDGDGVVGVIQSLRVQFAPGECIGFKIDGGNQIVIVVKGAVKLTVDLGHVGEACMVGGIDRAVAG